VQVDSSAFLADPELIQALDERSTPLICETDRLLFRQDAPADGAYILHEGEVRLTMNSCDGRTIFSLQATRGSLLGLPALVSEHPYSLSAIACAGAQVSFVSRADFFAIIDARPELSLKMLKVLAAEVRTARMALS
jgi:CRP/FNR family transcriptional regulator, cyclic AMP receptor protein